MEHRLSACVAAEGRVSEVFKNRLHTLQVLVSFVGKSVEGCLQLDGRRPRKGALRNPGYDPVECRVSMPQSGAPTRANTATLGKDESQVVDTYVAGGKGLYFSLVTFVTLGFGDIWPAAWLAKIFVGLEVILGYVFLGMIVVLIARKFGR